MHELAIVDALIEQIQSELHRAGTTAPVLRVGLLIGRLSGVNPESVRFAFQLLSRGTPLEKAELDVSEPRASCVCRQCGARAEIAELTVQCPSCGSGDITIEGGQELMLESIEVDEPEQGEPSAAAP